MKRVHYILGVTISIFIFLHLCNHLSSLFGVEQHIEVMDKLRLLYRNIFVETILITAIFVQVVTGIKLFFKKRSLAFGFFERLQLYSGLYLAFFLVFHLTAVFAGRYILHLNTNIYFGAAGLNTFPFFFFFVPYYGLSILAFFGHLAAVHARKMQKTLFGLTPNKQASFILVLGGIVCIAIFYGLTNGFTGIVIPEEYNVIIGK